MAALPRGAATEAGEAAREQRRNLWFGTALVVAGMGAAIALALTTGYEVPDPEPCEFRLEAPCRLPDSTVAWRFTTGLTIISRDEYEQFMLDAHDAGF